RRSRLAIRRVALRARGERLGAGAVFFFQAEDGIRDKLVTGVQTCALPISDRIEGDERFSGPEKRSSPSMRSVTTTSTSMESRARSEERRVGKECRSRSWP